MITYERFVSCDNCHKVIAQSPMNPADAEKQARLDRDEQKDERLCVDCIQSL